MCFQSCQSGSESESESARLFFGRFAFIFAVGFFFCAATLFCGFELFCGFAPRAELAAPFTEPLLAFLPARFSAFPPAGFFGLRSLDATFAFFGSL